MKTLSALVLAAGIVLWSDPSVALPQLKFDDPLGPGGTVSYTGTLGQPIVGTAIPFQSILGLDTPLNAGVTLFCDGCLVSFTTGGVVSEGPLVWDAATGGSLTMTGGIAALGLPAGTVLAQGSFDGPDPRVIGTGESTAFAGFGLDTKHAALAAFFGLSQDFVFLHTALELGTTTIGADGSFSGAVTNADFNNLSAVPAPATLLVLGAGLLGLVAWRPRGG